MSNHEANEGVNKVIPTTREVIERKLLDALSDESKVAILATQQDVEDMIFALESYSWNRERIARCRDLAKGLRQLAHEAFHSALTP